MQDFLTLIKRFFTDHYYLSEIVKLRRRFKHQLLQSKHSIVKYEIHTHAYKLDYSVTYYRFFNTVLKKAVFEDLYSPVELEIESVI